jgi:4-carboxy-3-alkylbut-2-enoyl-[acp] decarboxylase
MKLVETQFGGPVAVIRLADTAGRNVFTPALDAEFRAAFGQAAADPAARVVLLAGLPQIFCAGGSRADLLGDPGSVATTEHEGIIRAPLRCPLPVVAAMRGHAIGGGLLLGLYCDLPLLSERSVYTANFMGYGFLPAMGASWLLPYRLGPALGAEVMLGAAAHRGAELRARGVPLRVLPHDEVEPEAVRLAHRIAAAPRVTLEHAKAVLAADWRRYSDQAYQRELPGHLETIRLPEVRRQVSSNYGVRPVTEAKR